MPQNNSRAVVLGSSLGWEIRVRFLFSFFKLGFKDAHLNFEHENKKKIKKSSGRLSKLNLIDFVTPVLLVDGPLHRFSKTKFRNNIFLYSIDYTAFKKLNETKYQAPNFKVDTTCFSAIRLVR